MENKATDLVEQHDRLMHTVEELSTQLNEKQITSDNQDNPTGEKEPSTADSTTSWSKQKQGPLQIR